MLRTRHTDAVPGFCSSPERRGYRSRRYAVCHSHERGPPTEVRRSTLRIVPIAWFGASINISESQEPGRIVCWPEQFESISFTHVRLLAPVDAQKAAELPRPVNVVAHADQDVAQVLAPAAAVAPPLVAGRRSHLHPARPPGRSGAVHRGPLAAAVQEDSPKELLGMLFSSVQTDGAAIARQDGSSSGGFLFRRRVAVGVSYPADDPPDRQHHRRYQNRHHLRHAVVNERNVELYCSNSIFI